MRSKLIKSISIICVLGFIIAGICAIVFEGVASIRGVKEDPISENDTDEDKYEIPSDARFKPFKPFKKVYFRN